MKKIILNTLLLTLGISIIYAQHPSVDPNYELIFEDNFDIFDRNVWEIYPNDGNVITGPTNSPISNHIWSDKIYVTTDKSDNLYVADGILHQVARRENYLGKEFTNSHIQSLKLFGPNIYIEAKVKLPHQNPTLEEDRIKQAAFWMYRGGACIPQTYWGYREIDILEFQGKISHNQWFGANSNHYGGSTGNLHYCDLDDCLTPPPPNTADPCRGGQKYLYQIPNQNNWHTVASYWEKDNVSLLLDDIWHNTRNTYTPNNIWQPMSRDMRIINGISMLDGTVDGLNPADDPSADFKLMKKYVYTSKTLFPFEYLTDYIRIWQLKNDCNTVIFEILDFNTYYYALKKSITLGPDTEVPLTTDVISLRAADYIEFIDGFEVLDGREVSFNTNECPK